ncbi:hypothetical protein [Niameybacter massiliensis]|uniref:hypothetical protein n=1 Tax=Niameybacter massiliensis TaxID=1658108 RepID=UPI0006B3F945|nr:hypothetical protein [Niameybacter massiliensis]
MKKQKAILISILLTLLLQISIFANPLSNVSIEKTNQAHVQNINLAQDVFIEGLYENAVLYVGADIRIKGSVDTQATQKQVTWQVTGNNGGIDFEASGNYAKITGKAQSTVWVMARAIDGSDRTREYTVNVRNYPKDTKSQSLVSEQVTPILRRPFQQNSTILQVEVNKKIVSSIQRESALESYMRKIVLLGALRHEGVYTDEYYEYHIIDINNDKIEVRISKNDVAYSKLKSILTNVNQYNNGNLRPQDEETSGIEIKPPIQESKPPTEDNQKPITEEVVKPPNGGNQTLPTGSLLKPPSEGEIPSDLDVPNDEESRDRENIIILGGSGTSLKDPLIVSLGDNLTSQEKVATMKAYLTELQRRKNVLFVRKRERADFTSYIMKVSDIVPTGNDLKAETKNDFFIEIRVEKEDKEAYIPIIEMLGDLEKEVLQGIENKNIKDQNSSINEQQVALEKSPLQGNLLQHGYLPKNYLTERILLETHPTNNSLTEKIIQENFIREDSLKNDVLPDIFVQSELLEGERIQNKVSKEVSSQVNEEKFGLNSVIIFLSLGAAAFIKYSL